MTAWREHLDSLSPDERKDYEERAAIRHYDGHLTAAAADLAAYKDYCKRVGVKARVQDELFAKVRRG